MDISIYLDKDISFSSNMHSDVLINIGCDLCLRCNTFGFETNIMDISNLRDLSITNTDKQCLPSLCVVNDMETIKKIKIIYDVLPQIECSNWYYNNDDYESYSYDKEEFTDDNVICVCYHCKAWLQFTGVIKELNDVNPLFIFWRILISEIIMCGSVDDIDYLREVFML